MRIIQQNKTFNYILLSLDNYKYMTDTDMRLKFDQQCTFGHVTVKMLLLTTFTIFLSCSAFGLDPKVEFENFKMDHGKSYASLQEEELRFQHFQDNLIKIEKHNSEGHSWRMGVTKFADLSK